MSSSLLIREIRPVARKQYDCMASEFIMNDDIESLSRECTFAEKRAIVNARLNNWKIKKGNVYVRQTCKYEGNVYTFRAIPEIHSICSRLGLYP